MIRYCLLALLIAAVLACGLLYADYQKFLVSPSDNVQTIRFEVKPGDSLGIVSLHLRDKRLINNRRWFKLLAYLQDAATSIKAGEYAIEAGSTPPVILATLIAGRVSQHSLTFVEGWTFKQWLKALAGNQSIKHTVTGLSCQQVMDRLGYPQQHPEGRFFPETYFFTNETTDLELLQRAYQKMQQILAEEWEDRDKDMPLKTPYEALILASIVEKETGIAGERAEIAGVFIRRIDKGMLLQTDPTVIYGMGERYQGNIRRRDLLTDTPYNTYTRSGLPPTPIAMPGRAAIHAVLHPAQGDSLYFVANGNGSHIFSATLKQHNQAVNRYQRKIRAKP